MVSRSRRILVLLVAGLAAAPVRGATQVPAGAEVADDAPHALVLEALKPVFTGVHDRYSLATTAHFLSGRLRLSESLVLLAELPFAYAATVGTGRHAGPSRAVGNPYLGVALKPSAAGPSAQFGVRLPLAAPFGRDDDLALRIGSTSDPERIEAFIPGLLAVQVDGALRYRPTPAMAVRLRGGTLVGLATAPDVTGEWVLGYGVDGWYRAGRARLRLGAGGRLSVLGLGDGLDAATVLQVVAGAAWAAGPVRPALELRVPLGPPLAGTLAAVIRFGTAFDLPGER